MECVGKNRLKDSISYKELLAMEEGYRESTVAWAETLRALKARDVKEAPPLAMGDRLNHWLATLWWYRRRPEASTVAERTLN